MIASMSAWSIVVAVGATVPPAAPPAPTAPPAPGSPPSSRAPKAPADGAAAEADAQAKRAEAIGRLQRAWETGDVRARPQILRSSAGLFGPDAPLDDRLRFLQLSVELAVHSPRPAVAERQAAEWLQLALAAPEPRHDQVHRATLAMTAIKRSRQQYDAAYGLLERAVDREGLEGRESDRIESLCVMSLVFTEWTRVDEASHTDAQVLELLANERTEKEAWARAGVVELLVARGKWPEAARAIQAREAKLALEGGGAFEKGVLSRQRHRVQTMAPGLLPDAPATGTPAPTPPARP